MCSKTPWRNRHVSGDRRSQIIHYPIHHTALPEGSTILSMAALLPIYLPHIDQTIVHSRSHLSKDIGQI